jgi:hypothetical protein
MLFSIIGERNPIYFIQNPPQHIKLNSKSPSANGNARISPHTFSWQRPGKTPSAALSPADLFDFRPMDRYFGWKTPYTDVYLHIYMD